ncbi:alpha/beta hydrolase [Spirillospora sp. NPDC052269]
MGVTEFDLKLDGDQTLHVYDTETAAGANPLTVFWHHGTPNIGAPPRPLFPAGAGRAIRWVSYDRPGYGGSSPAPGRDVGSAAAHVSAIADSLGIDRFAVVGHSGGGCHALACGALLGDRVLGVISIAALAPRDAERLDWFTGMAAGGAESLHAAVAGRAAKERYEASAQFDPDMFTQADHAALAGEWSWFDEVVGPAVDNGLDGLIDDDLAYVAPWGFDPADIAASLLVLHGGQDRVVPSSHGQWLARHCRTAQLWLSAHDGHISVLSSAPAALDWLRR